MSGFQNVSFNPSHLTPTNAGPATPSRDVGLLATFDGTWSGAGFNAIWRPHFSGPGDHFLALNATTDTIVFAPIPGVVPNRGASSDVFMSALSYMQQITDSTTGGALHVEPGLWARVPPTDDPTVCESIVRLGSIPHGTSLLAQGTARSFQGAPEIPQADLTPFSIGNPAARSPFPDDVDLTKPANARTPDDQLGNVTQEMVNDPNSVLRRAIEGWTNLSIIEIAVSSVDGAPVPGGGTKNVAFLGNSQPANARASRVDSTFWIVNGSSPDGSRSTKILYTQTVLLDFNTLSWPHITVAALEKMPPSGTTPPAPSGTTPPAPSGTTPPAPSGTTPPAPVPGPSSGWS